MRATYLLRILCVSLCLIFAGCHGEAMSTKELKNLIDINLKKGTSNQEILNFFDEQGWVYDYDRHAERYQARDTNEDQLPDVYGRHQIYVYVDEEMKFIKGEVVKMYNAP